MSSRTLVAILVGLVGALFIWVVTPYNNFILGNSFIADDYLPVVAVFLVLVLVLGVNPLLRRLAPRWALRTRQLAVVFAILLTACITASTGLLRVLPYSLAGSCVRASKRPDLGRAYEDLNPPPSLFPDRLGYEAETPVSTSFLHELEPGESIPWGAWLGPLFSWGGFLLPWFLMMIALAVIVLPQWRDNERLPFPLLSVQQALIESPGQGHYLPPLFRERVFWASAGIVFGLHLLSGTAQYFPGRVPTIPLSWNLWHCFQHGALRYTPRFIWGNRLYFIIIGLAFFMPKRISFSIWFFQIASAAHIIIGSAYAPPFRWGTINDHRKGAFLAVPLAVLWLGRQRWAEVFRALFRTAGSAEGRRDRIAGFAFLLGCTGMGAWLLWVGVAPLWALALVVLSFLYALTVARMVAETGLPLFSAGPAQVSHWAWLAPQAWRTASSMYFSGIVAIFVGFCNRVCCATMTLHGLALDPKASPRRVIRLAGLLLAVVVISVVICGAVHLFGTYHHSMTLNGRGGPISGWGTLTFEWYPEPLLMEWKQRHAPQPPQNRPLHITLGAALAGVLQWLCLTSPRWPLHPIGLLLVGSWYAHMVWFNAFLGWLAKVLILRYGGSRVYTKARPFFLGLIMGEVFAMVFWALITGVRASLGLPYETVRILPF